MTFVTQNKTELVIIFHIRFSNSLIIHQVKTKEITSVMVVGIPGLNSNRFWRFYFSVFTLVFVSIEKIYQTLETVFHRLSKHLEFRQKYSFARRIFNSLLGVWIGYPDETLSLVFDILRGRVKRQQNNPFYRIWIPKRTETIPRCKRRAI